MSHTDPTLFVNYSGDMLKYAEVGFDRFDIVWWELHPKSLLHVQELSHTSLLSFIFKLYVTNDIYKSIKLKKEIDFDPMFQGERILTY